MSQNWLTSEGQVVHPKAPRGGGGAGGFQSARHFGAEVDAHGIPHPDSPAGRNAILSQNQEAALKAQYGVPAGAAQPVGGGGPLPVRMLQSMLMGTLPPELKIPEKAGFMYKGFLRAYKPVGALLRFMYGHTNAYFRLQAELWEAELTAFAEFVQDPQGWQLFSCWVFGLVPKGRDALGELVLDDEEWGNYMRKNQDLSDQINNELRSLAGRIAATGFGETRDAIQSNVTLKFHAEVGGPGGGFRTGYQILHGCNDTVGGLGVTGTSRAQRRWLPKPGPPYQRWEVTFDNLRYVWNDIEDHNTRYAPDIVFNDLFRMLANIWGGVEPQDYIVRIKWTPQVPVSFTINI